MPLPPQRMEGSCPGSLEDLMLEGSWNLFPQGPEQVQLQMITVALLSPLPAHHHSGLAEHLICGGSRELNQFLSRLVNNMNEHLTQHLWLTL